MGKNEDILIRDFLKSDLDGLLDLMPKCFSKEFEIAGFDPDHVRSMVNRGYGAMGRLFLGSSRLLGKEPIKFLVAEVEGKVVGTTIVNSQGSVGYISAVMVSPDHRRRGIATTLMKSAVRYVQKRRMSRAILHVISTNAAAKGVYSGLGFEEFEQVTYLVADTDSILSPKGADGVETRPYRGGDMDEVYSLYVASENPNHLRVFDFSRKKLRTTFWLRLFSFGSSKRIVALRAGRIVGSIVASYTTAKEAGGISSVQVRPEDRSHGIEKALLNAAVGEVRKSKAGRIVARIPTTRPELVETTKSLGFGEWMVLVGMSKEAQ